jgi:hypothetical protein
MVPYLRAEKQVTIFSLPQTADDQPRAAGPGNLTQTAGAAIRTPDEHCVSNRRWLQSWPSHELAHRVGCVYQFKRVWQRFSHMAGGTIYIPPGAAIVE